MSPFLVNSARFSAGGGSGHTYWRVSALSTDGNTYVAIQELEMRTTLGGSQAATGGTATASDQQTGYEASKAFDGNSSTFWNTNSVTLVSPGARQWIKYAFASPVTIAQIAITARNDGNAVWAPRILALEYSDDDSSWTTADIFVTTAWTAGATRTFDAGDGAWSGDKRFWRLRMTNSNGYIATAGVEYRATLGGSTLCSGGAPFMSNTTINSGPLDNAYDGTTSELIFNNTTDPKYLGYCFASAPGTIAQVSYQARASGFYTQAPTGSSSLIVESSSDGSSWTTEGTFTPATWTSNNQTQTFNL